MLCWIPLSTKKEEDVLEESSEFEKNLQEIKLQLGEIQSFDVNAASLRSIIKLKGEINLVVRTHNVAQFI